MPTKPHVSMSGDIFDCHGWRCVTGIYWIRARDAADHLTMHRTTSHNEELSGPNCQRDEAEKHCSKGLHCQYKSNLEIRPFSPFPQNASKIVFLNRGTP